MISPVLRLLVVSLLVAGALAGGALVGRARPLNPPPPPPPLPPAPTPLATPLPTPRVTWPGIPPTPCHRTSVSNSRLFPETGQAVSGYFANYWERNGGLAQQGYPISPVIEEVSELDGRPYQVQYFERAVFECHPGNIVGHYSPFAVLLAQLGTYQYRQKYPQGAPGQHPNSERAMRFPETGRTLGGEFRTYWEEHGGKYQQGLPISDEFTEVSPLDGKVYTVQYFERAVFEYHPENAPPYRVLLSQLGTLRYRAKYPTPPGPPPVALPPPDPIGPRFLGYVPPGGNCSFGPLVVADGAYLFWKDANSPNDPNSSYRAVLGYDVNAQRQLSAAQTQVMGGLVNGGRTRIWYGLRTWSDFNLWADRVFAPLRTVSGIRAAAVGDDTLYYLRAVDGANASELHAYNSTTGQTTRIATATADGSFQYLVAGSGYVAWSEFNPYQYQGGYRLYLAPARNPAAVTVISTSEFGYDFIIAGDHLIWTQIVSQAGGGYNPRTDVEVRMYTISTRTTQVLNRGGARDLSASENHVAWRISSFSNLQTDHAGVLDLRTGQSRIYELPPDVGYCVTLAGSALAYIREGGADTRELYLQPLP